MTEVLDETSGVYCVESEYGVCGSKVLHRSHLRSWSWKVEESTGGDEREEIDVGDQELDNEEEIRREAEEDVMSDMEQVLQRFFRTFLGTAS